MSLSWIRSAAARTAIGLSTDPRPAWLWARDGKTLFWHNRAAGLFGARLKSSGLRPADSPTPIKGQIARVARIGLLGRPLVSRMQFTAGRRPLSATCTCTLLALGDGERALLVVGEEPIAGEVFEAEGAARLLDQNPLPPELDYALLAADGTVIARTDGAAALLTDAATAPGDAEGWRSATIEGRAVEVGVFAAGPDGARLLVFETAGGRAPAAPTPASQETASPLDRQGLTVLIDRLAAREPDIGGAGLKEEAERVSDWDAADDEAAFAADEPPSPGARVGLRGLAVPEAETRDEEPDLSKEARTPEEIETVSRYNFEELSRILGERVQRPEGLGGGAAGPHEASETLIPLTGERLVLNRLPLGVLLFRDQEIVFANRALADLLGHESAGTLRAAGLSAIFPGLEAADPAGTVTHLLRRDGTRLPVSARLQTVPWQGRNTVMLSVQESFGAAREREESVRRFAMLLARGGETAYFEADREGTLTRIEGAAGLRAGQKLAPALAPEARQALEAFLAGPGEGNEGPQARLAAAEPYGTAVLFRGEAGTVFGFFEKPAPSHAPARAGVTAATLGRIGRELRRPLNTIAGFAELIATEAFGPLGNSRYLEYARDIQSAGGRIAVLADELDQLAALLDGALPLKTADIDLGGLLEACLLRVRPQASARRVLVRSAVSLRLPPVRADRATLEQAVLNLLASAIEQTGEGGKVVVSAQRDEDGSVSVHVRDGSRGPGMLAEEFVVFRDGTDSNGEARQPVRSSIGLTLTRSLVAVNAFSLSLDPAADSGTLTTLTIPASLVVAG